jgi:uncharacterized protein YukE
MMWSCWVDKFQRRADQQKHRFERDLCAAVEGTVQKVNAEIAEYNVLLNKRIKTIEKSLNEIREKRNDQVRRMQAEYKAFERTYHEVMKQLERNDKESAKLGEGLLAEMEQQRND